MPAVRKRTLCVNSPEDNNIFIPLSKNISFLYCVVKHLMQAITFSRNIICPKSHVYNVNIEKIQSCCVKVVFLLVTT